MSCNEILDMLHDYISNEVSKADAESIHRHLQDCPDCHDMYTQLSEFVTRMRELVKVSAPVHLHERINSLRKADRIK